MPEASNAILAELGSSGLKRSAGIITEEFLPQLTGPRWYKTVEEMRRNDPIIGACLFASDMLVRNVEWRVEPASQAIEDLRNAEFVRSCMGDMSLTWTDFVSQAMTMLAFGFAPFEIVYKTREGDVRDPKRKSKYSDNLIGWRKLALRAQDTITEWVFDPEGGIQGFVQSAPPDYRTVTIPMDKALLFRTTTERNNPEGLSVLRRAYRPWYFLKRIQEIEAIGIERDLAGLPVAEVPPEALSPNADQNQKATVNYLRDLVTQVRRDQREGLVVPSEQVGDKITGFKFKLLSTGGRRQFDTSQVIRRYQRDIAMSVLAEFLFLGETSVGSFALAATKTHFFSMALNAWLRGIADVLNTFAAPRLLALNGMPGKPPTIVPGEVESVSIEDVARLIQAVAGAGADLFPDIDLENALRRMVKLPPRKPE